MSALTVRRFGAPGPDVDLSALFALVPDEVVLAVASRDLELFNATTCLVGWTVREHLAALAGQSPVEGDIQDLDILDEIVSALGGEFEDWRAVFIRVQFADDVQVIEAAWTNRVLQAAENVDKPKIVLPADIFDTLELSAYAFGGIGAGQYNEGQDDATDYVGNEGELLRMPVTYDVEISGAQAPTLGEPICAVGHAAFAAIPRRFDWWTLINGNTISENDIAVRSINVRKGSLDSVKVTFEEWARELNVVRGDA